MQSISLVVDIAYLMVCVGNRQWSSGPAGALQQYAIPIVMRALEAEPLHLAHRSITKLQSHPKALQPFLPEMRAFTEYTHSKILLPILQYALSVETVCANIEFRL